MRKSEFRRIVFPLLGVVIALVAFTALVRAQTGTPALAPAGTQTPAPTKTPDGTEQETGSLPPARLAGFMGITLGFALLALGVLFWYLHSIQSKYYQIAERLGLQGRAVQTSMVSAIGGARDAELRGETESLVLTGPKSVTVGVESSEFEVKRAAGNTPADDAKWSVEPQGFAAVNPLSGARVRVIAAAPGTFKVKAEVSQPTSGSEELSVAAVTAQAAIQLPFVGQAYGSIAIAIVLIAAVIVLSVAKVLGAEGAATLLGALLGYIFGVTRSDTGQSSTPAKPGDK